MLDHIGIPVSELGRSKQFFVAALTPLGYKVIFDLPTAVGMGDEAFPSFWIGELSHAIRCILHSPLLIAQPSMRSTAPPWQPAAETMDNRECERNTIRTTTPHSCTIRTATTSKWCAARDREAQVRLRGRFARRSELRDRPDRATDAAG
jgi:hypothetical protein